VAPRGCLILLGISEAEENACFLDLWTYVNLLKSMINYPQNVASGAMMYIHKLLKTRSLTEYISGAGAIIPERLLTLAVTAFYLASKELNLPISTKYAAF
jgi:hypothetical protein